MIHDPELVEALGRLRQEAFDGHLFRVTSMNADPTAFSPRGGRWAPPPRDNVVVQVLYTSLEREGAVAGVAAYLGELTPVPKMPLMVHELTVTTSKTLKLAMTELARLGVEETRYGQRDYQRTQQIGAAINFLGLDGLIAPSARWDCDNLMIFGDNHTLGERLETLSSERVEVREWHGLAGIRTDG